MSLLKLAERIFDSNIHIEKIYWLAGHNSDEMPDDLEEFLEYEWENVASEIGYEIPEPDDEDDDPEEPAPEELIEHCVDTRQQGFLVHWSWPVPSNIKEDGRSYDLYGKGRWLYTFYTEEFDSALLDRMEALQQKRLEEVYQREHGKPFPKEVQ
jgi:hypothetical protein